MGSAATDSVVRVTVRWRLTRVRLVTRLATRILAVLVPAAMLVPTASFADTVTFSDGPGDAKAVNVGLIFGDLLSGTAADAPFFLDAPAETSTDVVGTTIDHARKRLTLTVQFRDLVDTRGTRSSSASSRPRVGTC